LPPLIPPPPRTRVARVRPVAGHPAKPSPAVPPPPAADRPPPPPPSSEQPPPEEGTVTPAAAPPPSPQPAPAPPPPAPEQASSNDEADVRFVVQHHLPQVQACYQRALKLVPGLRGTIELQFTVQSDGTVSDAHALSNSTGSEELSSCVART